jgi:ATP-binding cassette subfamily B protein
MHKKIMGKPQLLLWALKQITISAPKEVSLLVLLLVFQGLLPAFGLLMIQKIVNWVLYTDLTLEEKAAKEIRLFGFGHFLVDRYAELAHSFQKTMFFRKNKQVLRLISLSTLTVFGQLGCFIWFILSTKNGMLTGGELVMGLQALLCAQRELSVLMQHLGLFTQNLLFFGKFRTFLLINLPSKKTNTKAFTSLKKAIIFHHVSFSYPDGRVALKNVNLHIRFGEKIALVGENGAGKSTLIKLLLRFYNPTEGHITIDGIDLREWDLHSWRKQISAVFQDFGQYQLTVAENIALGEIERLQDVGHVALAAHKAGFAPIAEALPKGYGTLLGKEWGGTCLSGGQWQKLAMSRAFMKEASILILDEPTASLDPKSEQAVFQTFSDIAKDKTAFLITHRMASASMADRAIVLKDGVVIEQGHHQELLKAEGEYASLYSLQANYFRN